MDRETLTILCSFVIAILGVYTTAKMTNFRLSQLEQKVSELTKIIERVAKLETAIEYVQK